MKYNTLEYIVYYPPGKKYDAENEDLVKYLRKNLDGCFHRFIEMSEVTDTATREGITQFTTQVNQKRLQESRVRATPNNPDSSRGHTFYAYQFMPDKAADTSGPKKR